MRERRERREKTVNLNEKPRGLKIGKVRVTKCHKVAYIALQKM